MYRSRATREKSPSAPRAAPGTSWVPDKRSWGLYERDTPRPRYTHPLAFSSGNNGLKRSRSWVECPSRGHSREGLDCSGRPPEKRIFSSTRTNWKQMFFYANKVPHTAPSSPLGQLPLAGFSLELLRNCLWDWGLIKTELASLSLRHRLWSWWASF